MIGTFNSFSVEIAAFPSGSLLKMVPIAIHKFLVTPCPWAPIPEILPTLLDEIFVGIFVEMNL